MDGGEGEGLIGSEGVVLGLIAVSSLSFITSFSSHIPVVMSSLLACLRVPPLLCPHSPSSLSCGCRGAMCQQARRNKLGKGGALLGVVSSFVIWRCGT